MPTRTLPPVEPYIPAPPPTEHLDYADLPVIDLSKPVTAELAAVARDAMRTYGFLYAVNHGYTPSQTKRMFDIANIPFEHVSTEEKQAYAGDIKATGSYQGYKMRSYWHIDNGVHDQLEHYNINRDITKKQHPQALRPFLPEIEAFAKHCHFNVLHPILRLLAVGLDMPEDAFVDIHKFDAKGETYVRFMKYYPRSEEEEQKTNNVWLKGHTDFGSITILYSQPVAALQILSPDGTWRWVKHVDNALVINAADALEFLSGGVYKATVHRVVQPPPSQRGYTRLGVFYFAMPDDEVVLSPMQEREGRRVGASTMEAWRRARTSAYGKSELKKDGSGVDVEVINGVVVKHYN
ncbi:Clavaminate synthase-like protein [Heliocybe sulcata]|uniref:Clavaminate synthase-like protein n=1 Tax=Heliocybe sulcata TaxID=5364 RepID=A0A5C3N6U0_9AGAM|nr:Clavaminate synthase-like protein [Heliocybe sulcata]